MGGEGAREKKLHDAASQGDVTTFEQLLQEDPYVLDRVSYACSNKSPLHTATLQGNLEIVEEVLKRNPQLARELDSQWSSPLHIAAAQGYVEIASLLLWSAPSMCWSRDCHGMNPVHIAAMNGHVEILEELIQMDPFPAREKVDRGQTALHLCVKHRQLKALEVLVQKLGELIDETDDDGNTVLHLAARYRQLEMMLYLVKSSKIEKQSRNSKGLTALQILQEYRPDKDLLKIRRILINIPKGPIETMKKVREVVMVTVILIITMAFQAVVSPPGGVWQEDSSTHRAGEAVMASSRPKIFKHFVRANTVAFVSSLVTIFLLTTGLSSINIIFTMAVVYTMWMSLASIHGCGVHNVDVAGIYCCELWSFHNGHHSQYGNAIAHPCYHHSGRCVYQHDRDRSYSGSQRGLEEKKMVASFSASQSDSRRVSLYSDTLSFSFFLFLYLCS